MGLGVGRHNLKTFGTTVYGLTHPRGGQDHDFQNSKIGFYKNEYL